MKERIIYKNTIYDFHKKDGNLLFAPLNEDTDKSKSIVIYTEPKPKQRPRFTANGHAYTPKQTQDYENLIRTAWQLQHKGVFTGYVKLELAFYMPIPKSWSKKKQEDAVLEKIRPATTPDIDNLIKAIQDALNEYAWFDDRQIVDIQAKEYYALMPRIEITITEI